ncbi:hypothetical protein HPB50_001639 [Hyalomma asiaticum]|uniref:Uncharacterized protein n=1 Tax=Hyalomma asiaticum TaxID=266040 RepID=A0ACB7SUA5_HYAAI|nr:hypothetical protein HPB50_001639 [Hyalomma asiaticum]
MGTSSSLNAKNQAGKRSDADYGLVLEAHVIRRSPPGDRVARARATLWGAIQSAVQRGQASTLALSPLGGDSFCPPLVVRTGSAHGPAAVGDPPVPAAGQRSLRLADASLCPVSSLGKGPTTLGQAERAQHNAAAARNCASSHAALPLVAATMVPRETAVPVCIALSSCSNWHRFCRRPPLLRYACPTWTLEVACAVREPRVLRAVDTKSEVLLVIC